MGRIVVIEGTDFSGKTTQYDLLSSRLKEHGYKIGSDSFPNYDCESSYFVKEYLHGSFGTDPTKIDPKVASLFYALDRYASFQTRDWGKVYRNDGNVLFARYITSNILHQASKYESIEEKKEFIDWLYSLEVGLLKLPKEDCVILLDMPPEVGQELKRKRLKEQHGLTSSGGVLDIHEENKEYLEKSYQTALQICDYLGWHKVSCVSNNGSLKSIEEINDELLEITKQIFKK